MLACPPDFLALPQLGVVILINAYGVNNAAVVDDLAEGVAAILGGQSLSERAEPPVDLIRLMVPLAPLLLLSVWVAGSYLVIRRWRCRGEMPARGKRRLWRYGMPLGIDLGLATLPWLIAPQLLHAPMATIRLFAPDVFLSIVLPSALGLAWALARTILTIRPPVKTA